MEQEPLHLPDFILPDFAQPTLAEGDLMQPGLVLLDPARSALQQSHHLLNWPEDMSKLAIEQSDPALPDLLELDQPGTLDYPATNVHLLPDLENAPEVMMHQRPGEPDPTSLALLLTDPDNASLPPELTCSQLYTNDDEMSRRKRHYAMLELGLEHGASDDYAG